MGFIDHYSYDILDEDLRISKEVLAQFCFHISCILYLSLHALTPANLNVGTQHIKALLLRSRELRVERNEVFDNIHNQILCLLSHVVKVVS